MSEINGYVRVKKVYATTEDEVTLIVEPIDGAIPENGIKMQDGTYLVVWSMKYVKDLIREFVINGITHEKITEDEPLAVEETSFLNFISGSPTLSGIANLITGGMENPGLDPGVMPVHPDFPGGSGTGNNS